MQVSGDARGSAINSKQTTRTKQTINHRRLQTRIGLDVRV